MQGSRSDYLDIEVALAKGSFRRLTRGGKSLDLEVVKRLAGLDSALELDRFGAQLLVGEGLERRLCIVDRGDDALELSECPAFSGTKNLGENWHLASMLPVA
jgi:hypothetical protein